MEKIKYDPGQMKPIIQKRQKGKKPITELIKRGLKNKNFESPKLRTKEFKLNQKEKNVSKKRGKL